MRIDLTHSMVQQLDPADFDQASTTSWISGDLSNGGGSKTVSIVLGLGEFLGYTTLINKITVNYYVWGDNGLAQILGANGKISVGYINQNGADYYPQDCQHSNIGKGEASASYYNDSLTTPYVNAAGQCILRIVLTNPIAAAVNRFWIKGLTIDIDYTTPSTATISAVNKASADMIGIYNGNKYGEYLGLSCKYGAATSIFNPVFYAKTFDGRKIIQIDIFKNGTLYTSYDTTAEMNSLVSIGAMSSTWDEVEIGTGYFGNDANFEVIIYFEEPPVTYKIFVGQTQALRAYVGQKEILNIL